MGVTVAAVAVVASLKARRNVQNERIAESVLVRLGKVNFDGNRLKVAIIISNPNTRALVVRSVVGNVWINGTKVGNVESFTETVIEGNKKTTLYLDVRLLAPGLLTTFTELYEAKKMPSIVLQIVGSVNVDNDTLSFTVSTKVI